MGRPLWRGVSHQYAFFVSLLAGLPLVLSAATPRASFAVGVYVASLAGLLGTSALYHRVVWPPRARYWMGQVDVSMIFVLIAGSFTPIVLLLLRPGAAETAFWAVWAVAAAAIAFNLFFRDTRKAFRSIVFVVVGAAGGIALLPSVVDSLGAAASGLFAVSGVLYAVGAVIYGLQRPDPLPSIFGYHEVFHALVVVAAAVYFVTIAVYVVPY